MRDTYHLLTAAGLAPVFAERSLDDEDMAAVREGVELVLAAYEPFPCLAVDRGWRVLRVNAGDCLHVHFTNLLAPHFYYQIANLIAIGMTSILNFVLNDIWTFGRLKLLRHAEQPEHDRT